MDPITLAATLLGAAGEVAKLAAASIDAARAGDDQKALDLLDQALQKQREQVAAAETALAAVAEHVKQRIVAKFDQGQ